MRKNIFLIICYTLIIILITYLLKTNNFIFLSNNDLDKPQLSKDYQNQNNVKKHDTGFAKKNENSVIDQSLLGPQNIEINNQKINSVLGSIDEKVEIEVKLIDGNINQPLANYEFEYKLIENPVGKYIKLKTNAEGKFKIAISRVRAIGFVVSTNDYADSFCRLNLVYGKNECNVFLNLGSKIEIKATDQNGQTIYGLKAFQVFYHWNGDITTESISINFDNKINSYFLSKISIGRQELYFTATDYQRSALQTINIIPNFQNKLSVVLAKSRRLFFDINAIEKPEFIFITKPKALHKDGLMFDESTKKVFKNNFGLYEYELNDHQLTKLILTTENYLPKTVELISGQDIYSVSFLVDFKMKLKIINQKGEPIPDAVIKYTITKQEEDYREANAAFEKVNGELSSNGSTTFFIKGIDRTGVSDANGTFLLSGLYLKSNISLFITHKDYADFNEELWHIEKDEASEKTVKLKEAKSICGKIKVDGNYVAGANIYLVNDKFPAIHIHSNAEGRFCFKKINENDDISDYRLIAFHHDYGFAEISDLKTVQKDQEIDINLKKELSLSVKVVDNNGNALSNKKIVLKARLPYLINQRVPLEYSVMTDSDGKCQIFNMPHFEFNMFIEDEIFGKGAYVTKDIPLIDFIFKVEKNNLIKITAIDSNGETITKKIMVTGYDFEGNPKIVNTLFINNEQYLELANEKYYESAFNLSSFEKISFQLPGFAVITTGSFDGKEVMPNEFLLQFQKGFDFNVRLISAHDAKPLSNMNVYLTTKDENDLNLYDGYRRASLVITTNELGEANFTCLVDEYFLEICELNFSFYSYNINVIDNGEMLISLKNGGNLKAHFTFPDNFEKAELYLQHNNLIATSKLVATVDSAKDFEAYSIIPGTYLIKVILYFKDGAWESMGFPTKIIIEDNKNLEINLDDLENSKTSLTILVLNQEKEPIPNALFKLYMGNSYQLEDFYQGQIFSANYQGKVELSLLPNIKYYGVLESNPNYQMQIIEPFELQYGQNKIIEALISKSRKLENIQVLDLNGNPIEGATFIYRDLTGKFFVPHSDVDLKMQPFTNENGYFADIRWPKSEFKLIVSSFGYEFKEITIPENQLPNQIIQIKLNNESSIQCDFSHILTSPISIGVLNDKGELLPQVILQRSYIRRLPDGGTTDFELPNYRTNIRMGSQVFSNLTAGTYYIGYFKDGTKELIAKQGPIELGIEENLVVKSNFELKVK